MATDPIAAHILVSGRVQGVGFRWFVREHARRLGLSGTVENLPDGSVEIAVEGPKSDIEHLLSLIRAGDDAIRVADCRVSWLAPTGRFEGFHIKRGW